MTEAVNAFLQMFRHCLSFFNTLFSRIYNANLEILGIPYYLWIIILIVAGFFIDIFGEMVE